MKIRFKTEQEFIRDYGRDFRDNLQLDWNSDGDMDYLFGTEAIFSDEDIRILKEGRGVTLYDVTQKHPLGCWQIKKEFLILGDKEIVNKSKSIIDSILCG